MRAFLNAAVPGFDPPNRHKTRKHIIERYKQYRKDLAQRFKNESNIAFTTDLWKNRKRMHFITLTAHVLNKDFESLSFVASFRSFHGRHLAKRIKAFLLNEVRKLKIIKESIVATATDNASDVKCATKKDLGLWISCFCHNLNLTLKDVVYGVAHTKDDDDDGEYEDFITDEEAENAEQEETEVDTDNSSSEDDERQCNCEDCSSFLNTQQTTDEILISTQKLLNKIRKLIKKVSNF